MLCPWGIVQFNHAAPWRLCWAEGQGGVCGGGGNCATECQNSVQAFINNCGVVCIFHGWLLLKVWIWTVNNNNNKQQQNTHKMAWTRSSLCYCRKCEIWTESEKEECAWWHKIDHTCFIVGNCVHSTYVSRSFQSGGRFPGGKKKTPTRQQGELSFTFESKTGENTLVFLCVCPLNTYQSNKAYCA